MQSLNHKKLMQFAYTAVETTRTNEMVLLDLRTRPGRNGTTGKNQPWRTDKLMWQLTFIEGLTIWLAKPEAECASSHTIIRVVL